MKIEQIYIHNITSLKGEHFIKLPKSGLLAIVGPTGAGKSSILDAISLALFGKMPRYEQKGAASDEPFMSKGCGVCEAQVVFRIKDKRYLAGYHRHRARNKAEGALAVAQRFIAEFSEETLDQNSQKNSRIICNKIKQCDAMIEELCGLNYETFINALMLPQGRFASFLQSKDKSALLALFADLKIYESIGKLAYENGKNLLAKQDELKKQIQNCSNDEELGRDLKKLENKNRLLRRENIFNKALKNRAQKAQEYARFCEDFKEFKSQAHSLSKMLENYDSTALSAHLNYLELNRFNELLQANLAKQEEAQKIKIKAQKKLEFKSKYLPAKIAKLNSFNNLKFFDEFISEEQINEKFNNLLLEIKELNEQERNKQNEEIANNYLKILQLINTKLNAYKRHFQEEITRRKYQAEYYEIWPIYERAKSKLYGQIIAKRDDLEQLKNTLKIKLQEKSSELKQQILQLKNSLNNLQKNQVQFLANQLKAKLQNEQTCPVCGAEIKHKLAQFECKDFSAQIDQINKTLLAKEHELNNILQLDEFVKLQNKINCAAMQNENFQFAKNLLNEIKIDSNPENILQNLETKINNLMINLNTKSENTDKYININNAVTGFKNSIKEPVFCDISGILGDIKSKINLLESRLLSTPATWASAKLKCINNLKSNLIALDESNRISELAKLLALPIKCNLQAALKSEQNRLETLQENIQKSKDQAAKDFAEAKVILEQDLSPLKEQIKLARAKKSEPLNESSYQYLCSLKSQINNQLIVLSSFHLRPCASFSKDDYSSLAQLNSSSKLAIKFGTAKGEFVKTFASYQQAFALQMQLQNLCANNASVLQLARLIGSADGKLFNEYAQLAALKIVINQANVYLRKIYERYEIIAPKSPQDHIRIRDFHAASSERSCASLSGGETFVISLALALGLTQLASRRFSIDTLFIDEGFGSLDENSLDIALSALIGLVENKGDKLIGIISHVGALEEKITNKILLKPRGNGVSELIC